MAVTQEYIKQLYIDEPKFFQNKRLKAFEIFKTLPKLSFRHGINIVISPDNLNIDEIHHEGSIQSLNAKGENVEILSLHEAYNKYPELIEDNFSSLVSEEDNTQATILETIKSTLEEGYRSSIVEIIVGNNSNIQYGSIQSIGKNCYNFSINRSKIGRDSHMEWLSGNFGI